MINIGTPLSQSSLRIMLLGAGELGKEIIIELQRFGVEVIAVDRYENAPGHQVAHRWHVVDMTDAAQLRALIDQEKPHIIVPEIEAIATEVLGEVEAAGICEVIPTAKAVQLTMNREGIRTLAAETLGLPTSAYAFAESEDDVRHVCDNLGFPCLIKPVMSSSGKGQSLLKSSSDIATAWEHAQSAGRVQNPRVIVEGFVDFDYEITLLTVRAKQADGKTHTMFCEPIGHRQENGDYVESWQPQKMSERALQSAQSYARKVADALGGRGIFGMEFFVKGDQVWFSEVSPRPHDTGLVTLVTQRQSEFALHALAILGLPVDTTLLSGGASAVIYGQHDAPAISFGNLDAALSVPHTTLRLFGKPQSYQKRRMGVALAYGNDASNDVTHARDLATRAAGLVQPTLSQDHDD